MIKIENVTVCFEDFYILRDINLILSEKKIGIIGSNGSGKSTFVRLLNGLQLPDKGTVKVGSLDTKNNSKEIRKKVGFIFQNPDNQIVFPIVEEDIAFGLKNLGWKKEKIQETVNTVLSNYGLLHLRSHSTHHLSGGQKQLLAISGVLVMEPEYIIFDEPTTLLDLRNKKKIFHLIENLKQSVIVVTHDLDLLENFDRVIFFDQGQVISDGKPEIVISKYQTQMCNEANNIP